LEFGRRWGGRVGVIGGLDVDFLARADEPQIRRRTRETLQALHPAGGYVLGSGNSITDYVPLDNYLAMLDEGRRFTQP
jgi:uroporphyrinogen decarboxylase